MAPRKSDPRDERTLASLREALEQRAALDRLANEEEDQVVAVEERARGILRRRK